MPKGIYILVFQLTAQEINTLKVILYQVNCNVTTLQFSENLWYIYSRFIYKCTIVYILFSYLDKYMSLSTEQLLENTINIYSKLTPPPLSHENVLFRYYNLYDGFLHWYWLIYWVDNVWPWSRESRLYCHVFDKIYRSL